MLRRSLSLALLAAALGGSPSGCKSSEVPGAGTNAPMGSWVEWQTLEPLVEVAQSQVPKTVSAELRAASKLLIEGRALSADRKLATISDGSGRHWVAVARADLASLYFTKCIRGVAWRLEDLDPEKPPERSIDYDPQTRIEAGDISVEAMLTNLDDALAVENPALQVQARIARARVTAYVSNCAPNEDVAERAGSFMRTDLATLAAEGHLTPDLAYVWANIQMTEYSGAAARPFLLLAQEGGYDDPSITYLLAVIALEQAEYDKADELAIEAAKRYAKLEDPMQQAQCFFIRGEVERSRDAGEKARKHYQKAMELEPAHVAAMVGIADLERVSSGPGASSEYLAEQLAGLLLEGELDVERAQEASRNLEALVILTNEDLALAEITRDALLISIDSEPDPIRRGMRYYYAATLDVRLGDYTRARGHGALARDELAETPIGDFVDVDRFLQHLDAATG